MSCCRLAGGGGGRLMVATRAINHSTLEDATQRHNSGTPALLSLFFESAIKRSSIPRGMGGLPSIICDCRHVTTHSAAEFTHLLQVHKKQGMMGNDCQSLLSFSWQLQRTEGAQRHSVLRGRPTGRSRGKHFLSRSGLQRWT